MCESELNLKTVGGSSGQKTTALEPEEIRVFVDSFVQRREAFLQTSARYGSPLYVLEESVLLERSAQFTAAFSQVLPEVRVYYAMKSNNHPEVIKALVRAGLGVDVSSGVELGIALESGAADIVFSGPGKTKKELTLAVENSDRTRVLIDSFGEFKHLESIAAEKGVHIRAGVRLTTDSEGLWRKFGIPLKNLSQFFDTAQQSSSVSVEGLQFHTSWNLEPSRQVEFIVRLGNTLSEMTSEQRSKIEFIDIGGGFWPSQGEWLQSDGRGESACGAQMLPAGRHYKRSSTSIEEFAAEISHAVRRHLFPYVSCCICAEPGRWLCNDAMHLLLTVVDKKAKDLIITDAGTNAIGWERFETDYFPVINLSRPDLVEHACQILGSLCTPHDVWGYAYWGKDIQPGDLLLIPTQGAYTYSLRQEFIKPLPAVVMLDKSRRP
jgi:diaminopimelate decarboxylase